MTMTHDPIDHLMTDVELDALLAAASAPPPPLGATSRLIARLDGAAHNSSPPKSRLGWLAGLPLAASLAVGIYLGAAGDLSAVNPFSLSTSSTATAADTDTGSGLDEALDFNEDTLT
jgi:hypothetical protein